MATIAEDVGGEERATRAAQGDSVASSDAKSGAALQPHKDISGSTEASPTKMVAAHEQDELVQILTKGAEGNAPQKQFVSQFVLPNQRVRTREEIENEVIAELREIDRLYNII